VVGGDDASRKTVGGDVSRSIGVPVGVLVGGDVEVLVGVLLAGGTYRGLVGVLVGGDVIELVGLVGGLVSQR
jgi:hypothetical protein